MRDRSMPFPFHLRLLQKGRLLFFTINLFLIIILAIVTVPMNKNI
jgi:hypothetical protein